MARRVGPALSLLSLVACGSLGAGCEGGGGQAALLVELIRADGVNAARGASGTLSVEVRQAGSLLPCPSGACEAVVNAGDFDLSLPVMSPLETTTIAARLELDESPELRFGATPPFTLAGEGLEQSEVNVRLVMEPPSTCTPLELAPSTALGDLPRLVEPRRDLAVVIRRNQAVLIGGVAPEGPSVRVEPYDQIVSELRLPLMDLPVPAGRARGLSLSEDHSLVVGDGGAFLLSASAFGPPTSSRITLPHAGLGFASALVASSEGGVLVGGEGSRALSRLDETGRVRSSAELSVSRAAAAAAVVGEGVLVVGGGSAEDPPLEWVPASGESVTVDDDRMAASATGGWLAVSPEGDAALWIGFEVGGDPSAETWLIDGCPACRVASGPTWERARSEASGLAVDGGTFWLVGGLDSTEIDLVRWDADGNPRIEAGPSLTVPRAGAAVFEQARGIVTVAGGSGGSGLRGDLEHCSPDALTPR